MGRLVSGRWSNEWYHTDATGGRFVREESQLRHAISNKPGAQFAPEANRYHLYVSLACPWAHRTLIFRKLKNLESIISVSVVDPYMGDQGWFFSETTGDAVLGVRYLHEVYTHADPEYTGRVTVPVLWDKKLKTAVNNESAEIIRFFNAEFKTWSEGTPDYYPKALQTEIDEINQYIYHHINNGVYKAGFATTQHAYEEAVDMLFQSLAQIEQRLGKQTYLVGEQITEADWRLFTTLVRFDAVYVQHFKCNLQRLVDFPNLWNYTKALYQVPGIRETVNFDHIKKHYFLSHKALNPSGIIPKGPQLDFEAPHTRPVHAR